MIRILLVLIAVLMAVLAFVFDRPWLYAAAGLPLLGVLGLLGRQLWGAYGRSHAEAPSGGDDASLEELGIMDVRPQNRDDGRNGTSAPDGETERTASGASDGDGHGERRPTEETEAAAAARSAPEPETATRAAPEASSGEGEERPVLGPFLESLRAAVGAQTVCLLVQEEVILEYRIEALASTHAGVRRGGTFETQSPLLTATMSRQPVTIRRLDEEERADLGYYDETVPPIAQVALAPVPQTDSATTVFLLADATADVDLEASRSLLEQYAETVGMLRDAEDADVPAGRRESAPETGEETHGGSSAAPVDGEGEPPRPRREIIAEEMRAADAGDDDLALVLVHLNRAESIARRGEEAVATAERLLRTRLEHLAPGQRVERFGELTYGLFPRRGLEEVESWAADLQDAMAEETGELEGGVSVGVAVRGPRHDADELRADATEALREAYETGTCTIVA
jgi:hypothetical protein